MFGIGSTELLVILLVALIVLGPRSLAGFSRKLGKFIGEFRRVSTDFQRALNVEAAQEEAREEERKRRETAQKAEQAKEGEESAGETAKTISGLPPDSPVAQALAKAAAEAGAAEQDVEKAREALARNARQEKADSHA